MSILNKPIGEIWLLLKDLSDRGLNCKYILDVGANVSNWSRTAKSVFPNSIVYLIEPLIEMEPYLKKFCSDFPGSKYFLNGAGAKDENLHLFISDYLPESHILEERDELIKSTKQQREIKIITIDSLIENKEIEIPELVKLDIQGFELEALKGATKLFGKTEVFILEISFFSYYKGTPIFSEVILFMAERGYYSFDFSGFLRRPYDGALGQIDVCFVKRDGLLRTSNSWA